MPTKASKETKTPKEAKAPKTSTETKASKAAKAPKEKGGKAESASAGGQKPNALQKPLQPSKELAAVVGSGPLPRGEVVSKVWDYIKKQDLQNPENRREILADDKLEAVFGKKKVTMFEMNKYLAQHLTSPEAE
jgi:upstream activation factor subunit UAF30